MMKELQSFQVAPSSRPSGADMLALACLAIAMPLAFNPALFNDGDTSWHIAAGRLMLDTSAIPAMDPFSFTFRGSPWTAHEWLAEVLMAGLHRLGAWSALAVAAALSVALTLFLIARDALRFLAPIGALAVTVGVALLLLPFILARPHVFALPIVAAWTLALLRARENEQAPPLAAVLLMLLWANLHGSFAMGLLLTVFFGMEAILYQKNRIIAFKGWALFGLATLVAALLTPHGPEGLLFPLQVSGMQSLHLIGEWRATDFATYPLFGAALLAAGLVLVVRRNSIPLTRALLIAGLAWLAIEHVRHQMIFAIVAALILVRVATARIDRAPSLSPRTFSAVLAAMIAISAIRLALPLERPDSASNPLQAIERIPAELRREPVLNSYSFGGPLILAGIQPYIDGRADMYGDAFMFEHRRLMSGNMPAFHQVAQKHRIAWTIVSPQDPLSNKLDSERGWRRLHADKWAVIHVRD